MAEAKDLLDLLYFALMVLMSVFEHLRTQHVLYCICTSRHRDPTEIVTPMRCIMTDDGRSQLGNV